MSSPIFEEAIETILACDKDKAVELAKKGLAEGVEPLDLIRKGFVPGISEVGERFGDGRMFLPELILAAAAMQAATEVVNAALPDGVGEKSGRVIIGTVKGDMHDIGKTIVLSLFKANGFEVKDLGRDVSTETFIEEAKAFNADIIGTSSLLTTTMDGQKELEKELKKSGLKDRFKTMVGGAPVTQRWADRIGADAFAENAPDGVKKAKALLGIE
jgi:corrinoid protein of di/trimethylamine methyltransferase